MLNSALRYGGPLVLEDMLDTLDKKADPKHAALLVVDVQNDFCANGGAFDKLGCDISMHQEIIPRLLKFIDESRKAGVFVIFTQNCYNTPNNWFLSEVWLEQAKRKRGGLYLTTPLCEKGSWGAEFYLVRPEAGEAIMAKHRFDAFEGTDLDLILRSRRIRTLIMTGLQTNVCVETTSRRAFVMDYYVIVVKDLVASDSREAHERALLNLDSFFGQAANSEEIVRCFRRAIENREHVGLLRK